MSDTFLWQFHCVMRMIQRADADDPRWLRHAEVSWKFSDCSKQSHRFIASFTHYIYLCYVRVHARNKMFKFLWNLPQDMLEQLNTTSDNIADRTQTVFRCASEILGWKDVHDPQIVQKPQSCSSGLYLLGMILRLTCTTCWSLRKILNRLLIWFNYQWKFTSAQSSQRSKLLTDN